VAAFGVEGTGCYGAGLARFLGAQGQVVVEVNRPDRQARRRRGKSDPVDAEAAARAVLAGQATAIPKTGDSMVEMVRCLRVARATAMKARTQAANALRALLVTAPVELREQLRDLDPSKLAATAARLRPGAIVTPTAATKLALRTVAERQLALTAELTTLDAELDRLTARAAPALRELCGVGAEVAGALLVTAGDDPARLRSDAAFSMLCGASPIEASSGKTVRHRLNRGGDRQANTALYRIVVVRLRWHEPTRKVHGSPHRPGPLQEGDHPLSEAVRGPRGLRSAHENEPERVGPGPLTSTGASRQKSLVRTQPRPPDEAPGEGLGARAPSSSGERLGSVCGHIGAGWRLEARRPAGQGGPPDGMWQGTRCLGTLLGRPTAEVTATDRRRCGMEWAVPRRDVYLPSTVTAMTNDATMSHHAHPWPTD